MDEPDTLERTIASFCAGDPCAGERLKSILSTGWCPEIMGIKNVAKHAGLLKKIQKRAFERLSQEAERGNLFATAYMGDLYIQGMGVKKDPAKGLALIEKSAKSNNPSGCSFLGAYYKNGIEGYKKFTRDFSKAVEWFEKGISQNYPSCMVCLGEMHEWGQGFEKNLANANKYYMLAAKFGRALALTKLTLRGSSSWGAEPFLYFTPKNIDFTYELLDEQQAEVRVNEFVGVKTVYNLVAMTVRVTYTGLVDIGQHFTYVKSIHPSNFNWKPAAKIRGYKGGDTAAQRNVCTYLFSKAIADVICEADSLIMDLIAKAEARADAAPPVRVYQVAPSQNYPGVFFLAQNPPAHDPVPLAPQQPDPAQMLQIMQMLQQNPEFFGQVAVYHQVFQSMNTAVPTQSQNNSNYQPSQFGARK